MKQLRNTTWTKSAWISFILIAGIVFFRFVYPPVNILSWDVFGYYLYLPAAFIYHDLQITDITWVQHLIEQYQTTSTLYQATAVPDGGMVLKYSMGMALLNAPGFFFAHLICLIGGIRADGFSLPYQYAWAITGLIFTAIGIWVLRKILLEFFTDKTTSLLLVIIVLATNYFQLTAFDGYLSHNYLFTLYTLIVWFTIQWHKKPSWKYAIALGLAMGLAVLVRPSELVCVIIPILWGISNSENFRQKLLLLRSNYYHIFLVLFAATLAGMPQLLYWKYSTGHWLFYSYNNAGEGFDFAQPYLKEVLFSFRKGWLIYTPVMFFALAGFTSLFKSNRALFYCILIYFLVNLYIVSSWTCWWYAGGSYSQRALLSSYVILAIPLGYFIRQLQSWNKQLRIFVYTIIGLLLMLNLFQTWQWAHGVIDRTRMTKAYYFATFGKTSASDEDRQLLLVERPTEAYANLKNESSYTKRLLAFYNFEDTTNTGLSFSNDTVYSGKTALKMDSIHPFSPGFESAFSQLTSKDHAWIRAGVWVYTKDSITPNMASIVITFEHNGESYNYSALGIDSPDKKVKPGEWTYISMDYLTPEVRSIHDKIKVYFWLQGRKPVWIDDLKVEVFY